MYNAQVQQEQWEKVVVNVDNANVLDAVGHGFGVFDKLNDKIIVFGGVKIKFNEPLSYDLKTDTFKATPQVLGMKADRFFYNNYTFIEDGKKVIALGRKSVHEIDLSNVENSKVIGNGYF